MILEEPSNMDLDDVLDVIKDFPVKPLGRKVLVTINMLEPTEENMFMNVEIDESQYIVAKGPRAHDVEPGMKVVLDLEKLMVTLPNNENSDDPIRRIKIKPYNIDGKIYAMIDEGVIEAIDER